MSRIDYPLIRPTLSGLRRVLLPDALVLLDAASGAATELGVELWAVGGAIRDLAAGVAPAELDLACGGHAAALATATAARLGVVSGEVVAVHREPRFATARIGLRGRQIDLAELRSERYARPGALPEVRPGATIEEDLARRDFSVNAIALGVAGQRHGELLDPFAGLEDLGALRLRALHADSFRDDATRLWRGARYAAALGLRPEPQTAHWIEDGPRWIARISGRRLWAEFERTAATRRVGAALRLLEAWGALRGVHPAWSLPPEASRALARRPGPHPPSLLLAVLIAPLAGRAAIADRLTAPRSARRTVDEAARLIAARDRTPDTLTALEGVSSEARVAARWLDPAGQRLLQRDLRRWERTRPPLDARALLRLGVEPGPALGGWLDRLRRERYLGTLRGAASARRTVRARLRAAGETEER